MHTMLDDSCKSIETIDDISSIYKYSDEFPKGNVDYNLVSCGQTKEYKELKNKLKHFSNLPDYNEKYMCQLMCSCCKELKPETKESTRVTWWQFYRCMLRRIDHTKYKQTFARLGKLITHHM